MLIDKQGRIVRADKLPRGGKAREAALASAREVLVPERTRDASFTLGARAFLKETKLCGNS